MTCDFLAKDLANRLPLEPWGLDPGGGTNKQPERGRSAPGRSSPQRHSPEFTGLTALTAASLHELCTRLQVHATCNSCKARPVQTLAGPWASCNASRHPQPTVPYPGVVLYLW